MNPCKDWKKSPEEMNALYRYTHEKKQGWTSVWLTFFIAVVKGKKFRDHS